MNIDFDIDEDRVMDLYINENLAIERLVMEWVEHGKLIIAYDYDGTVFDYHNTGNRFYYVTELLRECEDIGANFIVYSCSPKSRHQEMKDYLDSRKIPWDKINEPIIELADGTGKIFFNILLDDRAGLNTSYLILDRAVQIMKGKPKDKAEACKMLKERFKVKCRIE